MKNFWTALLLLTFIAIVTALIILPFSAALSKEDFLIINALLSIVILYYIIDKYYYDRTEESNKLIRSIILFVITWLISIITAAISGVFFIVWLVSCGELK